MGRLAEVAQAVFDVVEAAFVAAGDPPERRYVHVGDLPEDFSEQLVVQAEGVAFGLPSEPGAAPDFQMATPVTLNLAAWVLREVPTMDESGTPPVPEAMTEVAAQLLDDGWLLLSTLVDAADAGRLVDGCSDIRLGPMEARGPSGGIAGFRVPILVGL